MTRSPGAPGRHMWPFIVAALAVAAFLVGGAVEHTLRHRVTRPGSPTAFAASPATCVPPACDVIRSAVTLSWTPADAGGTVAAFAVLRDGTTIPGQGHLSPLTTRFVDESVTAGSRHSYAVVASNSAGSARSTTLAVSLPWPPVTVAMLEGSYRVRLIVRQAKNLASLQGIARPLPGSRGRAVWVFVAPCPPNSAPCGVTWGGHAGTVDPRAAVWAGSVTGPRAACRGGPPAPAPIRLHLLARAGAMASGAWVVSRFTGTSSVRFHCAGFAPSHGTVEVVGARR